MPSFSITAFGSYFNRIFQLDRAGNNGADGTTRSIQTGDGVNTCASISDDVFGIQPQNDNTAATCFVNQQDGDRIFSVDTINSKVLVGSSQVSATILYQKFSVVNHTDVGGTHYPMSTGFASFSSAGLAEDTALGTGTDPATSLDISAATSESNAWVQFYWYLPDAITLDSAIALSGGTSATDSGLNFHIMAYTLDTSSNYGDLSAGSVVADSSATSGIDEDVIKTTSLTIQTANIAAGKVLLATYESDAAQVTSSQMIVKYHIQ